MNKIFAILMIILTLSCSIDDNPIQVARDRTVLEDKILGTWVWASYSETDTVLFRGDLTYESMRKGMAYDGTFTLASDSLLKLSRRVVLHGREFEEVIIYDLGFIDAEQFKITSHNAPMIYRRLR